MENIDNLRKLAGITEDDEYELFELHVFNIGNSRPFISEGSSVQISSEVDDYLNKAGWDKLVIYPKK